MPKGVEQTVHRRRAAAWQLVYLPLMPKGVEQPNASGDARIHIPVYLPLMPKGVEQADNPDGWVTTEEVYLPLMPKGVEQAFDRRPHTNADAEQIEVLLSIRRSRVARRPEGRVR